MIRLKRFLLILTLMVMKINAQELIKTNIRTSEVHTAFNGKKSLQWAVPVSQFERKNLIWTEKETSFSSRGIRSFVGYNGEKLVATLSISSTSISGSIFTEEGELQITNKENFIYLIKETETFECHTDEKHQHLPHHKKTLSLNTLSQNNTSTPDIKNSNILRVYRLAVLIDYSVYSGIHFRDKQKALTFLSDVETFLNEIYVRDLGIKFEVLKDDKLIRDTAEKEVFEPRNPNIPGDTNPDKYYDNIRFITLGTRKFNDILGEKNYDLGISLTRSRNGGGVAFLEDGYKKSGKASATTNTPTKSTIAHEIGHLFGARHTFSNSSTIKVGDATDQIEIGKGYSVMSYGSPRDFFALYSIYSIRRKLVNIAYYDTEARDFVIGQYEPETNIPFGILIDNQAPVIDKAKIKTEYTIPQNTYFQFYIPTNDPDGDNLQYLAHQTDIKQYPAEMSIAKFITKKGIEQNNITFQPQFVESGGMLFHTDVVDLGKFTFWLGARDSRPTSEQYITKYDLAETKVNIVKGIPFKLTNKFKEKYKGNENIQLTWDVDNSIFPTGSKVRILFSDDFGKTFNHTLVEETENDGSFEITLPNIEVGNTPVGNLSPRAGVIKVEVINGLAYALSQIDPKKGGFTITLDKTKPVTPPAPIKKEITFINPPKNKTVSCSEIPAVETPQATGGCSSPLQIEYKQIQKFGSCPNSYTLERTWTAKDNCGSTKTFTQTITVEDNVKPEFVGNLPQNMSIKEGGKIPQMIQLTATDNCSAKVTVTTSQNNSEENGNQIITYTWTAKDECGNTNTHSQKITIIKSNAIQFVDIPQDITVSCDAVPKAIEPKAVGGCGKLSFNLEETKTQGKCANAYILKRTWTAKDNCGNTKSFTQTITVEDNVKPEFVGNLPQNISIKEGESIPQMIQLTAADNCSANVTVTTSQNKTEENGNQTITYNWVAEDECGNTNIHSQKITIIKQPKDNSPKQLEKLLYPNPAGQEFYLQGFNEISKVKIYDTAGRLIKQFNQRASYNIANLVPESYIVTVETPNGIEKFKMIKK